MFGFAEPHLAKARFLKPHIDRTNISQPLIVKAGQQILLDVPVSGEPPPTGRHSPLPRLHGNKLLAQS